MQIVLLTTNVEYSRFLRYLGPYQIAWWMRQNDYSVQVLDFLAYLDAERRMNLYKKFITSETKIVSFSPFAYLDSHSRSLEPLLLILNEIHENFPWVKIVIGGPFSRKFVQEVYQKLPYKVDAVFDGAGEHSFLEYCDYVFGRSNKHPPFQIINDQKVIGTTKEYDIQQCRMRFSKQDFILEGEALPIELSRGCIFKCAFCQYPHLGKDKDDFNRNMGHVKDTMLHNYENFKTTSYYIADDTLNSHRQRTKDLHAMSKILPFKLKFIGYMRLDLLDAWPEQQEILPEAGLISCHLGVESISPESCKLIGKNWGAKNHKVWIPKISELWKDKVSIRCSLIAGLGSETEKDWEETNKWFSTSGVTSWFYNVLDLQPSLGLSLFEQHPEKYGYKFDENDKWYTDTMTHERAWNWVYANRTAYRDQKIPNTWEYLGLQNLGYKDDVLKTTPLYKIMEKFDNKVSIGGFLEKYYQMAMSY